MSRDDASRPGAPPPAPPLFEVKDVRFRYVRGGADALNGVTVTVPAGATVCVVGKNGCGKSTLLYLLGLLWEGRLPAGEIYYHSGAGTPVALSRLKRREKVDLRSRHFGFVLQTGYLMPQLTCAENIAMPLLLLGHDRQRALFRARELLRRIGGTALESLHDRPVDTLSGGQAQVMAVLRAIVHDPAVVFADEPTQKLDAKYRENVLDLLAGWRQGEFGDKSKRRSLLLVLHDAADVCRRADYLLFFTEDRRIHRNAVFPPKDILREVDDEQPDLTARIRQLGYERRIDRWIKEGR